MENLDYFQRVGIRTYNHIIRVCIFKHWAKTILFQFPYYRQRKLIVSELKKIENWNFLIACCGWLPIIFQ